MCQIREEKFSRIGDYMYYFSGTSKKYIDAQQFCARVNAYLVEFYNLQQYREVCSLAASQGGKASPRQTQMRAAMRLLGCEVNAPFRTTLEKNCKNILG